MLEYLGRKEKGFTLMELLIAVAIVVILAGVGIPVYLKFMAGAKHAEAGTNLASISMGEQGYKLANGVFLACGVAPRNPPTEDAVPWADNAGGTFGLIDFTVAGDVRFVYEVESLTTTTFTAGALGDTNGDGTMVIFTATESTSPAKATVATTVGALTGGPDD